MPPLLPHPTSTFFLLAPPLPFSPLSPLSFFRGVYFRKYRLMSYGEKYKETTKKGKMLKSKRKDKGKI
jgi:hypothetical protein